jgi:TPR repeat protein
MCYLKGNGVAKDEAKGFEYMKKAVNCRSVYIKAFWEISKCYRFGRGVERDLKKAEYYEQEAEKAGNDDALWMKEQQYILNSLKQQ